MASDSGPHTEYGAKKRALKKLPSTKTPPAAGPIESGEGLLDGGCATSFEDQARSGLNTDPSLDELPDGPWLEIINPAFIVATYPSWAAGVTTREDAARAFREHGVTDFAALDEGLHFEPGYFREANPAYEGADDLSCYRAWLIDALASGSPGSSVAHLSRIGLQLKAYPVAFPWEYYIRLRPGVSAHKWAALEDFCSSGFAEIGALIPFGAEAADFLFALGRHFSLREDRLAIRAYELARVVAPLPAAERQHLADAYLRERLWRPAFDLYREIIESGEQNTWTLRNLVRCCAQIRCWESFGHDLNRARLVLGADPLWGDTAREAHDLAFQHYAQLARALMARAQYAQAEELLANASISLLPSLYPEEPAKIRVSGDRRLILILANADDEVTYQRRILEKISLFADLGYSCKVHQFLETSAFDEALPDAAVAVIFRAPALPSVMRSIVLARSLGVLTIFESDAPAHNASCGPTIDTFRGKLPSALFDDLRFGLVLQRVAATLCDVAIAPTRRLAEELRPLVRRSRSFVLPDTLMPGWSKRAVELNGGAGDIRFDLFVRVGRLFYLDADPESFGGALLGALISRPDLTLCVGGPIHLDHRFDSCSNKITRVDGAEYWPALHRVAINLTFRCTTPEDQYETEISWAEAASAGLPSLVVAPIGAVARLQNRVNVLRAATPDEWSASLVSLLDNPTLRTGMGDRAREDTKLQHGHEAARAVLTDVLRLAAAEAGDR